MQQVIQSDAFSRAALRSERYRTIALLAILAVIAISATTRSIVSPRRNEAQWVRVELPALGVALGYQIAMLLIIGGAERSGRGVPSWVWVANTLLECALPTSALIGLTHFESYLGPYRALVSV